MSEHGIVRKRIYVYGSVQGVGFRYRAQKAAQLYDVSGWVRNEDDGSVSLEVQGTQENIDRMFTAIERGTFVRIEDMTVRSIPVVEGDRDFTIQDRSDFWGFWHT